MHSLFVLCSCSAARIMTSGIPLLIKGRTIPTSIFSPSLVHSTRAWYIWIMYYIIMLFSLFCFHKIIMHQLVKVTDAIWLLQLTISSPLIHALGDPNQTPTKSSPTRIRARVPNLRGRQLTNRAIPHPYHYFVNQIYFYMQEPANICHRLTFILQIMSANILNTEHKLINIHV